MLAVLAGCRAEVLGEPLPAEVLRWEPSGVLYVALAVRVTNDRDAEPVPHCLVETVDADDGVRDAQWFDLREPLAAGEHNTFRVLTRLDSSGVAGVRVHCQDRPPDP